MRKFFILALSCLLVAGVLAPVGRMSADQNKFVNLGPQIFNTNAITSAAGYAPDGTALAYVLLQGEPAILVAMDIIKNKVWDQKTIPNTSAAWAITVDGEQNVWIGGTPSGHLYRYTPNSKTLTDVGKATVKGTSIHDLEATQEGAIYGSTSPNGGVFRYVPGKGFTDLGQTLAGKTIARSIAYNDQTNTLFIGLGAKAQLVAWNLTNNKKQTILPAKYQDQTSIYDLDEENGFLFAKTEPSKKILVFDSDTLSFLKEMPASSRGVSPLNQEENAVYYSNQYTLYRYNLDTGRSVAVGGTLRGTEAVSMDVIDLHHEEYPGNSVVGLLGNTGTFMIYNPGKMSQPLVQQLNIPAQPIPIYNIEKGPDGLIYANGFVSGKVTAYNPGTGETKELLKLGQAESIAGLKEKLYFGVYPGAYLYEYDTSTKNTARKSALLFQIGNGQERIVAMTGSAATNNLYMGTHPKNGEVGGALAVYNPSTKKKVIRRNVVPEQSVISLAESGGYIYGGTSIFSNGKSPEKNIAVFFRLKASDPNGKIERIPLPMTKPRMIHALAAGKDGMVWGLSDGNLFAYDPKKKTVKTVNITPTTSGRFKNGNLVIGKDGKVYGTVEQKLFMVDPKTMKKTTYPGYKASDIATDNNGNLYFSVDSNLWMLKK